MARIDLWLPLADRDAWYSQRNVSRTEAKRRYISTLIETMHKYAAPSPDAQELISELEFVWGQIKSNTSSSSSSPGQAIDASSLQRSQELHGIAGDRTLRTEGVATQGNSRLRMLSPVSQPEESLTRKTFERAQDEVDDEEDEEDFQEARNTPYEDEASDVAAMPTSHADRAQNKDIQSRKWRRRVEQALTKVSVEVAAMREQMDSRALHDRRRHGLCAWMRWIAWTVMYHLFWDAAILCAVLIWMRIKGDRRFEEKLTRVIIRVKTKLATVRWLRYLPRLPPLSLP